MAYHEHWPEPAVFHGSRHHRLGWPVLSGGRALFLGRPCRRQRLSGGHGIARLRPRADAADRAGTQHSGRRHRALAFSPGGTGALAEGTALRTGLDSDGLSGGAMENPQGHLQPAARCFAADRRHRRLAQRPASGEIRRNPDFKACAVGSRIDRRRRNRLPVRHHRHRRRDLPDALDTGHGLGAYARSVRPVGGFRLVELSGRHSRATAQQSELP